MNRLRRFITWGLTLAIFVSCGAASLPGAALWAPASQATHSSAKNPDSHAIYGGASRLPGVAIRHEAETSGPQVLERLQSQVAGCQLPGSDATIQVIEPLCLLRGRIRCGDSLQSLKTRWQV